MSPKSPTPRPTDRVSGREAESPQRPRTQDEWVSAKLHRAADELAAELHKAADEWEASLKETILWEILDLIENMKKDVETHFKDKNQDSNAKPPNAGVLGSGDKPYA